MLYYKYNRSLSGRLKYSKEHGLRIVHIREKSKLPERCPPSSFAYKRVFASIVIEVNIISIDNLLDVHNLLFSKPIGLSMSR